MIELYNDLVNLGICAGAPGRRFATARRCSIEDGIRSVSVKPSVLVAGRRPGHMMLEFDPRLQTPPWRNISGLSPVRIYIVHDIDTCNSYTCGKLNAYHGVYNIRNQTIETMI